MRNITGQAVIGEDLYGRESELELLWEKLEQGEHILMLAPRRVGKTSLMLELRREPRENWDVFYVDVEGAEDSADCLAAIIAALAGNPKYRRGIEKIPFAKTVTDTLKSTFSFSEISVSIEKLRIELKGAIGRDWKRTADQLLERLESLPDSGSKLLIILDEFPILVSRMLKTPEGKHEVELLLSALRRWRQSPQTRGKVSTLVGGSIGLEGILRRFALSGLINDLAPFQLDSWNRDVAVKFLEELGDSCDFRVDERGVSQILDLLSDPVPYHLQLFFSTLRQSCKGDPSRVSESAIERCFTERLAGPGGTPHLDHYAARLEIMLDADEREAAHDILNHACRRRDGARISDIEKLTRRGESMFLSALRNLESDGYVRRDGSYVCFRSNLLREWWRKNRSEGMEL